MEDEPDWLTEMMGPPILSVTYELTVREQALVGRTIEVIDDVRTTLLQANDGRKPSKETASAIGSSYAPYGRWTQRWDKGGRQRLATTLNAKVGGFAGWLSEFDAQTFGDLSAYQVVVTELSPGWLGLRTEVSWLGSRGVAAPPGIMEVLDDLMIRWAHPLDATFGCAVPAEPEHHTNLEAFLRVDLHQSLETSATVLRGYSWITYLPPGVVQRLGGTEAVLAWEGFYALYPVEGGGVLLRATENFDDYDHAAVRRVFDAVRPALPPPGAPPRPKFIPEDYPPFNLIWADEL